ncbi:hypothetical protein BH23GEM10_BH23GEM10_16140 [soil metagenome]
MEIVTVLAAVMASAAVITLALGASGRRRRRTRAQYQELLQRALEDGVLSQDEIDELDAVRRKGDLTAAEVRMAALAIYRGALRDAAADARLTPDEDATLRRLQEQLDLSEQDLGVDLKRLNRLRMLARVAEGSLPEVAAPVPLVPDERCHWVVQCTLADRIPATKAGPAPLAGISFAVLGSEPFATSGRLDPLRPSADILPSDVGTLIVTSRRTIFQGAKRTISVPHARAEQVTLHADGMRFDEIAQVRRYFLLDDAELSCAILLMAARIRRAEIRPARPVRST